MLKPPCLLLLKSTRRSRSVVSTPSRLPRSYFLPSQKRESPADQSSVHGILLIRNGTRNAPVTGLIVAMILAKRMLLSQGYYVPSRSRYHRSAAFSQRMPTPKDSHSRSRMFDCRMSRHMHYQKHRGDSHLLSFKSLEVRRIKVGLPPTRLIGKCQKILDLQQAKRRPGRRMQKRPRQGAFKGLSTRTLSSQFQPPSRPIILQVEQLICVHSQDFSQYFSKS